MCHIFRKIIVVSFCGYVFKQSLLACASVRLCVSAGLCWWFTEICVMLKPLMEILLKCIKEAFQVYLYFVAVVFISGNQEIT